MDYRITTNTLTVAEYQSLRGTTSWEQLPDDQVAEALKNDLFSVSVYLGTDFIGMGRVIGDGTLYFYIQDMIVHPDHQGKYIGKFMMEAIEEFLNDNAKGYAFIGLMAAKGTSDFYRKLGYRPRPGNAPGMYRILSK
ncbi:GNAT family N-acetyltransferase [Aureisphaera galaxeae]|uniref:GNAT family N-acetyltransferase n=1 Tax=Aureisphaera galaxeae TaxID=1538023 RepID=UPI0023505B6D|nr:GNAT family N-acetyltransferase [Aureisphaera galaxeae]MDC8002905.1 GNAT family N-acetyltransferase [Aureisphaera galaxeae]